MEEARRAQELDALVLSKVSVEELSDLEVLFYLGRDRVHGEHYDAEVERTVAKNRQAKNPREAVHHLMSKMNLFEAVIAGCAAAGRPSLGEQIRSLRVLPAAKTASAA